jgi:hypothetical protein
MHSSGNICFANGRIWSTLQTAATPNLSAQGFWSWDREWVAQQPGDYAPFIPGGSIMPYRVHGIVGIRGSGPGYAFCVTAFDPVTNLIWSYADDNVWSIHSVLGVVANPAFGHSQRAITSNGNTRGGWAVYVPGPDGDITQRKILVGMCRRPAGVGGVGTQEILVHYPHNNTFAVQQTGPTLDWDPDSYWSNWAGADAAEALGQTRYSGYKTENGGWALYPGINPDTGDRDIYVPYDIPYMRGAFLYGMGAVYSAADDRVYVGVVPSRPGGTLGGHVHVLNPRTMTWQPRLTNTGIYPVALVNSPTEGGREWGCWQRFNIVEFGEGGTVRALIYAADAHGPTYAWRIS